MSSYKRQTKHPITGKWEIAQWLDDYFGPHRYGVKFGEGDVYEADKYEWETSDGIPTTNPSAVEENNVLSLIKYPVKYESMGSCIFDADSNKVLDIRGWGRLQYLPEAEKKQDAIGQFVADAINEKLSGITHATTLQDSTLRTVLEEIENEMPTAWFPEGALHLKRRYFEQVAAIINKHIEK